MISRPLFTTGILFCGLPQHEFVERLIDERHAINVIGLEPTLIDPFVRRRFCAPPPIEIDEADHSSFAALAANGNDREAVKVAHSLSPPGSSSRDDVVGLSDAIAARHTPE